MNSTPAWRRVGPGLCVPFERNEEQLDPDLTAGQRMAEQVIEVAGLGAAALDAHALPGLDERTIATLFGFGK